MEVVSGKNAILYHPDGRFSASTNGLIIDNTTEYEIEEDRFGYLFDTEQGSSGGVIFQDEYIVGMHKKCGRTHNIGTKITSIVKDIKNKN